MTEQVAEEGEERKKPDAPLVTNEPDEKKNKFLFPFRLAKELYKQVPKGLVAEALVVGVLLSPFVWLALPVAGLIALAFGANILRSTGKKVAYAVKAAKGEVPPPADGKSGKMPGSPRGNFNEKAGKILAQQEIIRQQQEAAARLAAKPGGLGSPT